MTTSPARNAPCPCGSGRKYKHCCLARQAGPGGRWTPDDRQRALARLAEFTMRPEFDQDRELPATVFWGGRLDRVSEARQKEIQEDGQAFMAFLHWLCFDLALDRDHDTYARRYLDAPGVLLSTNERAWLERMASSCMRLYEVVRVRPDEGLDLKDVWTDEVVQVRERRATRQLVRWDLLAVRVVESLAGGPELEGVPYVFPPDARSTILDQLRGCDRKMRRGQRAADDPVAFFKRMAVLFNHFWLDLVALRPMPTVVTTEGDPLAPCRTVFDVVDRAAVTSVLDGSPVFQAEEPNHWAWTEAAPEHGPLLGTLTLGPRRLTLETMSEARAQRGKELLETLLGKAVRFRAIMVEDFKQALERAPARKSAPEDEIPPEVQQEIVGAFLERHYREWPDHPLPALNGRTPRHAARLKTMRPKVVELVKQVIHSMEHERREGRPWVDLTWLWTELGLGDGG
jgi:hypothetical protein